MSTHVVLNRRARAFRRDPGLEAHLRAAFGGAVVHATDSLDGLQRAARSWSEDRARLVVLAGGDGTFMAGASAAVEAAGADELPTLALLPAGTVGRLARSLGVRGAPAALARRYAGWAPTDPFVLQPSLRVRSTGSDGEATSRIGFIVGTGLVARFFDVYEARGAGGVADAARIVARTFASSLRGGAFARRVLDPLPCTLEVDGRALAPEAWSLVCAAVVRDLGLGMKVTYRAGEDPGRVHLVAHALSPKILGPRVGRVLAGRSIGEPGEDGFDGLTRSFSIRFEGEGPWVLDGDRFQSARIDVTPGPSLRIARP